MREPERISSKLFFFYFVKEEDKENYYADIDLQKLSYIDLQQESKKRGTASDGKVIWLFWNLRYAKTNFNRRASKKFNYRGLNEI